MGAKSYVYTFQNRYLLSTNNSAQVVKVTTLRNMQVEYMHVAKKMIKTFIVCC